MKETLEEAMERLSNIVGVGGISDKHAFMLGTFWQQKRSYSEEDMKSAFEVGFSIGYERDVHAINENNRICKEWFEQFKKK